MATDTNRGVIDALIPKSIDDVIRKHRDQLRAYLSTAAELDALRNPIPVVYVKSEISYWAFITFSFAASGMAPVYLTGYNQRGRCSWMTSHVIAIDGDLVATKTGSTYRLVGEKSDDLDLPHICATLNTWGVGQKYGVPEFFF